MLQGVVTHHGNIVATGSSQLLWAFQLVPQRALSITQATHPAWDCPHHPGNTPTRVWAQDYPHHPGNTPGGVDPGLPSSPGQHTHEGVGPGLPSSPGQHTHEGVGPGLYYTCTMCLKEGTSAAQGATDITSRLTYEQSTGELG